MYMRHDELPVLATQAHTVDAKHYNIVFRALLRMPPAQTQGIRIELPGLKTLDLILQNTAWIIVDRAFNDIPVAAWTNFRVSQDRALHQPVECEIRFFHSHADIILERVLGLMDDLLNERLSDGDQSHTVLIFPNTDKAEVKDSNED